MRDEATRPGLCVIDRDNIEETALRGLTLRLANLVNSQQWW